MPLLADNFIYETRSETATKPGAAIRFAVDFLNECAHKCVGCFVNRSNGYTQDDLDILLDIVAKINASGLLFDELTLGPVDILGSTNWREVLNDPKFIQLMHDAKPILAMPTTMLSDDAHLIELLDIFRHKYPATMELEFQIVVYPEKLVAGDILYIEQLHRKIAILDTALQPACYAIQINMRRLKPGHLVDLMHVVRHEFETTLDFVPSVFRSRDPEIVKRVLTQWNELWGREVTEENKYEVPMPLADHSHGGFNYAAFSFSNGHLYFSPYVFEQVSDYSDTFRVPKAGKYYELSDLTDFLTTSWAEQLQHAKGLECIECPYLTSCTSRQVLSYMKAYDLTSCIYPRKVLDMYGHIGDETMNLYDWSGYSTADEIANGNWKNHGVKRQTP